MSRPLTPRNNRKLIALMNSSIMGEYLNLVARCSNGPDLIAGLSRKGLSVPCKRIQRFVKNGNPPTWIEAKAAATAQASGSKTQ